ncbi:secreted RxLR effector protein 161-like [Pistacia vera]|uniref:secreted RxLR effector protein 161-like n=1 Tax=Pistacia vera TaxID=55513 RepID=UPI0012632302|nr:secreted RxLR effector protein 161-like [Pistacia vera]
MDLPFVPTMKLSNSDEAKKVDEGFYRSLIGCLLYLTATRPDIMYATSLLSRFMSQPTETHFKIAKRVLRYVKGSTDFGVWFKRSKDFKLVGFSDNDWVGSTDDMRSTLGYAFFLNCGAIYWLSKKQETVAQSTAEAEYFSAAIAMNQAIWLRKILEDLKLKQVKPIAIMCDNQFAVAMAKNPVHHGRTKHIKIKFHAVREAE